MARKAEEAAGGGGVSAKRSRQTKVGARGTCPGAGASEGRAGTAGPPPDGTGAPPQQVTGVRAPGEGTKGALSLGQRAKGATAPGTGRDRGTSCQARALWVSYPVYDEHGEALDYLDDLEQSERNQDTWKHLIADVPINRQLEQARQETLAQDLQEATLLQGPTQAPTPTEEEALLSDDPKRTNLDRLVQGLQNLPDSTLNQLSQHIDEIRWRTPSSALPTKPPGLPDSTPQSTNMAWEIL